ncbi:hypothetical protein CSO01_12970 [Cellulomonas soli]|uniref:Uncharacterized protein n=1 Tax=Cellulomonas soli TaxID=931535 RepID=A0A512PBT8_9CELL|nr:hypothetical protein CSO01_12970 [Cellulomonas soli]
MCGGLAPCDDHEDEGDQADAEQTDDRPEVLRQIHVLSDARPLHGGRDGTVPAPACDGHCDPRAGP